MTFSEQRGGQYAWFKMVKKMAKLPNARRNSYVTKEDPFGILKEIYLKTNETGIPLKESVVQNR